MATGSPRAPTLVILPGMDGTGLFFQPFARAMPSRFSARVLEYPVDVPMNYDQLEVRVLSELDQIEGPKVLLASSFSGPLAIRIASKQQVELSALVLVATFTHAPKPRWLRHLVHPWVFHVPPPSWIIRRNLVGADASAELVREVKETVTKVAPEVMALRASEALTVDARELLRQLELPCCFSQPRGTVS